MRPADLQIPDPLAHAIEATVVGRVPLARDARLDVLIGVARTALNTTLSTLAGSSLPSAQPDPVDVRRFGATFGADAEWRLSEHTSLIIGYHAYPGVGSSRLVGTGNGTMTLLAGGVHFEF